MDKATLQRHYAKLKNFLDQYNQASLELTLNQCNKYILEDSDLADFIIEKMGAGNASYYFSELSTHKYFLKDMPRVLKSIEAEMEELNSLQ